MYPAPISFDTPSGMRVTYGYPDDPGAARYDGAIARVLDPTQPVTSLDTRTALSQRRSAVGFGQYQATSYPACMVPSPPAVGDGAPDAEAIAEALGEIQEIAEPLPFKHGSWQ